MNTDDTFGSRLKETLEVHGKNISEFARAIGVQRDTASKWVNGKAEPRVTSLRKIVEFMEPMYEDQRSLLGFLVNPDGKAYKI